MASQLRSINASASVIIRVQTTVHVLTESWRESSLCLSMMHPDAGFMSVGVIGVIGVSCINLLNLQGDLMIMSGS